MIECIHCNQQFRTMNKRLKEGQILVCSKCKKITPYQKTREKPERDNQLEKKESNFTARESFHRY